MFIFEVGNGIIATVTRVDIEGKDATGQAGDDADVPGLIPKPTLDHIGVDGGVLNSIRHQSPDRMFCRRLAFDISARANELVGGIMERDNLEPSAHIGSRIINGRLSHI